MKDETGGAVIQEFVRLKQNMHSFLVGDGSEHKTQKMCDKAFSAYHSKIQFISDQFETQEMYDKTADTCLFVFNSVPDQYMIQGFCDKVVSGDHFIMP